MSNVYQFYLGTGTLVYHCYLWRPCNLKPMALLTAPSDYKTVYLSHVFLILLVCLLKNTSAVTNGEVPFNEEVI